jgi:hypothetical protein
VATDFAKNKEGCNRHYQITLQGSQDRASSYKFFISALLVIYHFKILCHTLIFVTSNVTEPMSFEATHLRTSFKIM